MKNCHFSRKNNTNIVNIFQVILKIFIEYDSDKPKYINGATPNIDNLPTPVQYTCECNKIYRKINVLDVFD